MISLNLGKCALCEKPGVGAINVNANAGAMAPAVWEVRCDEHNPYWQSGAAGIPEWLGKALALADDDRYSDEFVGKQFRYWSQHRG